MVHPNETNSNYFVGDGHGPKPTPMPTPPAPIGPSRHGETHGAPPPPVIRPTPGPPEKK